MSPLSECVGRKRRVRESWLHWLRSVQGCERGLMKYDAAPTRRGCYRVWMGEVRLVVDVELEFAEQERRRLFLDRYRSVVRSVPFQRRCVATASSISPSTCAVPGLPSARVMNPSETPINRGVNSPHELATRRIPYVPRCSRSAQPQPRPVHLFTRGLGT